MRSNAILASSFLAFVFGPRFVYGMALYSTPIDLIVSCLKTFTGGNDHASLLFTAETLVLLVFERISYLTVLLYLSPDRSEATSTVKLSYFSLVVTVPSTRPPCFVFF